MTEAFTLRRLSAKVIGEIESITTLTAAIASGMGVTVLPESAARSLCYGKWLDGAHQHAVDEPVALTEYLGARRFISSGSGGQRYPAVAGQPSFVGES